MKRRDLVTVGTRSFLQAPCWQEVLKGRLLVTYEPSGRGVSNNRDSSLATDAPARCWPSPGTGRGSRAWLTNGAGCGPWRRADTAAGNKTADATNSGPGAGITLCNANTHDVLDSARLIVADGALQKKTPSDLSKKNHQEHGPEQEKKRLEMYAPKEDGPAKKTASFTPALSNRFQTELPKGRQV